MSSYQHVGIPLDVKRKIAQLGINMLLKMVSSRWGASPPCPGSPGTRRHPGSFFVHGLVEMGW